MILTKELIQLPKTMEEFLQFEPNDGFKYEWNDGELIKFTGMNKTQLYIYGLLARLFSRKGYYENGVLVAEQQVQLSGIQMRIPDIAYFTLDQEKNTKLGVDEIPEFVIEVISGNDNINKVEEKIVEYYKAGVKVVWLIMPDYKAVHVYTSRKNVMICLETDICSAKPVLDDFEISVNDIFED
jgi:Uma2 family endonuclease